MVDFYLDFVDEEKKRVLVVDITPYHGDEVDSFLVNDIMDVFGEVDEILDDLGTRDIDDECVCSLRLGSLASLVRLYRILDRLSLYGDVRDLVKAVGSWKVLCREGVHCFFLSEGSVGEFVDEYKEKGFDVWWW